MSSARTLTGVHVWCCRSNVLRRRRDPLRKSDYDCRQSTKSVEVYPPSWFLAISSPNPPRARPIYCSVRSRVGKRRGPCWRRSPSFAVVVGVPKQHPPLRMRRPHQQLPLLTTIGLGRVTGTSKAMKNRTARNRCYRRQGWPWDMMRRGAPPGFGESWRR